MEKEIFEKVMKIITDQLEVKESQIIPEARFVDDLGTDSLDIVEMVMRIEEEFGIEIPDQDAENLETIQQVVFYIVKRVKEKESAAAV